MANLLTRTLANLIRPTVQPVPPRIQEALDTVAAASEATKEAQVAINDYWNTRKAEAIAHTSAVIDDYKRADQARTARRAQR